MESTTGNAAKLQIRTGAAPANCAAANSGTLLCEITLPSDWWQAASAGQKLINGTWSGNASATGTAAHWRIFDNALANCDYQGPISELGLSTTSIVSGGLVQVNSFTWTEGNP